MGFLDSIIKIEREPNKPKETEVKAEIKTTPPVINPSQVTPEATEFFEKLLEEANEKKFPGSDFYEFYKAKEAMISIVPPEAAYKGAFVCQIGLTKDKLVHTASQYQAVIDEKIKEFEEAFAARYNEKVASKKLLIEAKTNEMNELGKRIQAMNEEIQKLSGEIFADENALSTKKNNFVAAGQATKIKIDQEIEQINKYILTK